MFVEAGVNPLEWVVEWVSIGGGFRVFSDDKPNGKVAGDCIAACPFDAIEQSADAILFNAACKMCKLCIKACPQGAIEITHSARSVNKELWQGVDANQRAIADRRDTADIGGEEDRLAYHFVRPVKIDVVGQLAQGNIGDRHRQGNHDCREEAPVLDEREHTMNIVDKLFHRKEARGVKRVARKAETPNL